MTAHGRWDPWKELLAVQKRMNQLFDGALGGSDFEAPVAPDSWTPVCDVFETPDSMILCLELPGLEQSDIDLRVEGDDLIVAGEREMEKGRAGEQFHRVERSYGKFARRFHLPSTVNRETIDASYRDGVLRVVVPTQAGDKRGPVRVEIH